MTAAATSAMTTQRERDLLKQVPDPLLTGTMIGNVKLQMPGLTQKITAVKQAKRNEKARAAAAAAGAENA